MSRYSDKRAQRMTVVQKELHRLRAEAWLADAAGELALRPEIERLEGMRRAEMIADAGQRHEDIFGRPLRSK